MEKIGNIVSVSTKGICEIVDIKKDAFVGAIKDKLYYILRPVENANNMLVYLPVDTSLNIRKLVSKAEAKNIVDEFENSEEIVVSSEADRLKAYSEIAKSGNIADWAKLLRTLKTRKEKLPRKQITSQEQKILSMVKDCVVSELSIVLGFPKQDIEDKLAL